MTKQGNRLAESAKIGLIAGVVTLCLCMIGVIKTFNARDVITDRFTLGQLALFTASAVAGFLASRKAGSSFGRKILLGTIAGFLSAVPTALLIMLAERWLTIRDAFINVSPDLLNIITFGAWDVYVEGEPFEVGSLLPSSVFVGIIWLVGLFTLLGLLGALFSAIPQKFRRAILVGLAWALGFGIMSEILTGILRSRLSADRLDMIFGRNGIQLNAFIALFLLIAIGSYFWQNYGSQRYQQARADMSAEQTRTFSWTGRVLLFSLLMVLPSLLGVYLSEIMNNVMLYVLMGLGLNIAVGMAGLLDLGYVTNFAIGAYVMALLTSTSEYGLQSPISFWFALPICVLCAMAAGFIFALPVLKMRGDYLAIATLGFGEIIRILARSDALKPLIGGAQGILQVPQAQIAGALGAFFSTILTPINNFLGRFQLGILSDTDGDILFGTPPQLYYLVFACSFLMLFVSRQLNNSRTGRRWMAIREDEDVAAAMGINTTNAKVIAFTLSAASGGLAGGIFAAKIGSVFPQSFSLLISVNVLSLIIVGGLGSLPGVIVGAFALIGIPELLREFSEFRILIYGIALIVMMLVRPEGLWPSEAQKRELRGAKDEAPPDGRLDADEPVAITGD